MRTYIHTYIHILSFIYIDTHTCWFFWLVTVTMAERNDDDQLTQYYSELIEKFSRSDKDSTDELCPQLTELSEMFKSTDNRRKLDTLLGEMNQILSLIDSIDYTLSLFSGPIKACKDKISEIHKYVVDCLKQHTEMYFMIEDALQFITNFKDFELDISALSESGPQRALGVIQFLFIGFLGIGVVGHIGSGALAYSGIGTSFVGVAIEAAGVLAGMKSSIMKIGSVVIDLGITGMQISIAIMIISAIILAVGAFGWIFATNLKAQMKLQNIQKLCQSLEDNNTLGQLTTFRDQLNIQRKTLKARLSSESCVDLNIIMKCYKDYKRALKEMLNNPSNTFTEEQLRDILALQSSFPLRDKLKFSETQAKQMILAFHEIATHKKISKQNQ